MATPITRSRATNPAARHAREMADMMEEHLLNWANYERDREYNAPRARHTREWTATQEVERLEDQLRLAQMHLGSLREEAQAQAHSYAA